MAYTDAMVQKVIAAAPLDLAKAQALGSELGVSYRSVISKAKQLGVEYVAKAPAAKKEKDNGPTKAATIQAIRQRLRMPPREGELTKLELETILVSLC